MALTASPHISQVHPNSPEFRAALITAGTIVAGTPFSVYSRHHHYPTTDREVLFEELVVPGTLALYPVTLDEATVRGLPSCWGVSADGAVIVLRYADRRLHKQSNIDVTAPAFLAELDKIAQAFAAAGLHNTFELNIAQYLFSPGEGQVTYEVTDEATRYQTVTFVPTPPEVLAGDWSSVACWKFDTSGRPMVAGVCVIEDENGTRTFPHTKPEPQPEPQPQPSLR